MQIQICLRYMKKTVFSKQVKKIRHLQNNLQQSLFKDLTFCTGTFEGFCQKYFRTLTKRIAHFGDTCPKFMATSCKTVINFLGRNQKTISFSMLQTKSCDTAVIPHHELRTINLYLEGAATSVSTISQQRRIELEQMILQLLLQQ